MWKKIPNWSWYLVNEQGVVYNSKTKNIYLAMSIIVVIIEFYYMTKVKNKDFLFID